MAYSILSLDGGGSWALIQVRILQKKYGDTAKGHDILKKYDMVIANSGGSLVLAAMCVNMSLDNILKLFLDQKILQSIFVEKFVAKIPGLEDLPWPRFKTSEKLKGLSKTLGSDADKQLTEFPEIIGHTNLQIIITGFDYERERAVYFRSNPKSKMESGVIQSEVDPSSQITDSFDSVSLLHAVHASSNAPVLFFDDPAEFPYYIPRTGNETKSRRFWDGAIGGNNNPIASGVLEAIANEVKSEEIRIVSIGTANVIQPALYGDSDDPKFEYDWLVKTGNDTGKFKDIHKLAEAILSDPPDAATFIAHHILSLPYTQTNKRLIRLNPLVKPIYDSIENKWKKPGKNWNEQNLKKLFTMDLAVTKSEDIQLINLMVDEYFHGYFQNQGIRLGGKAMEPILGHKDFQSGLNDWISWGDNPVQNEIYVTNDTSNSH